MSKPPRKRPVNPATQLADLCCDTPESEWQKVLPDVARTLQEWFETGRGQLLERAGQVIDSRNNKDAKHLMLLGLDLALAVPSGFERDGRNIEPCVFGAWVEIEHDARLDIEVIDPLGALLPAVAKALNIDVEALELSPALLRDRDLAGMQPEEMYALAVDMFTYMADGGTGGASPTTPSRTVAAQADGDDDEELVEDDGEEPSNYWFDEPDQGVRTTWAAFLGVVVFHQGPLKFFEEILLEGGREAQGEPLALTVSIPDGREIPIKVRLDRITTPLATLELAFRSEKMALEAGIERAKGRVYGRADQLIVRASVHDLSGTDDDDDDEESGDLDLELRVAILTRHTNDVLETFRFFDLLQWRELDALIDALDAYSTINEVAWEVAPDVEDEALCSDCGEPLFWLGGEEFGHPGESDPGVGHSRLN